MNHSTTHAPEYDLPNNTLPKRRSAFRRSHLFATGALATACLLAIPASLSPKTLAVQPAAEQAASDSLTALAGQGEFARLHEMLDDAQSNPQVDSLLGDLSLYEEHLDQRTAARREAFDAAMEEAALRVEENKVEEAMVKVIEAHDLADNPGHLLADEFVTALVSDILARAVTAEEEGAWVDAVSLYRLLDLLYEDTREYRDEFMDAAHHVTLLQLYNPTLLRDLYKARAERLGREEDIALFNQPEEEREETDDWTVKLEGIDTNMMFQAFQQSASRHVGHAENTTMLAGGFQNLAMMLESDGLTEVFPGLADEEKVSALNDFLAASLEDVQRPGRRINARDTAKMLEAVLDTNRASVGLPDEVVIYELTNGGMGELDEFSSVIWPEALMQFSRSIQGNFVGVGVQIQRLEGKLTIVTPLEGTPGMEAGLRADDVIARVNGKSTSTWSIERAVREITGPEGTRVTLSIVREGLDEPFDSTITRRKIELETIKGWQRQAEGGWDYWVDREAGIGYVRMSQFQPQTAEDMDAAIEQLQSEGDLNGLVLDLRFNPGGLLRSAVQIVDRFVESGRIVSTVNGDDIQTSLQRATRRSTYSGDLAVVVLINRGSASASEIVSGALQDHERAFIIGNNSYGKGSVQDIFPLGRGDALFKLTTQHYQLPSGRIIHRTDGATTWGIQPDLDVRMTAQETSDWILARRDADVIIRAEDVDEDNPQIQPDDILADGLDPQLEAALLYLKSQQLDSSDDQFAQRDE